ncbi:MAG: hypothetical protein IPQ02_11245 [Saprospiraceae bacterium]|uniref:Uncharacterized protein n=1 Tax=Candidatus Defluviibacterium haderslevense TaxID=2981993 RepID=A0A9D7SAN9_9BACT|nr:hypothetical protein [Candidatus Defluviibacterium haderslevense]MBL0237163.1 hypothetical protein [Candidatus Defluviibacterium haderslevense]
MEKESRLYVELRINVEDIETIQHLLERIGDLHQEVTMLEIDWVNWRIDKLIWVLPISNIFEQILIGLELMINVT